MRNSREVKCNPGDAAIEDGKQLLLIMFRGLTIQPSDWLIVDEVIFSLYFHSDILAGRVPSTGKNLSTLDTFEQNTFSMRYPVDARFRLHTRIRTAIIPGQSRYAREWVNARMSILTVSNLAKSYGADQLFSDITFTIAAGQKLGLIGRNGGGKTTLLKILLGQENADPNSSAPPKVTLAAGRRMGYLRQEAPVHPERTIAEEIEVALEPYRAVQARITAAEHAMSAATSDDALATALEDYTEALDEFESRGGWEIEAEKDSTLMRLGFGPDVLAKQVGACSGGEQTRLALAKLVLTRPDLLILDEPTNHLDINATEWLEGFLKDYAGAVILVSHDRYFLDAVVDTIAELEFQKLTIYKGNYSHFRRQKEERLQRQQELYENQQKEIERLKDLVKRNMGADATQSNIRHKTLGRIERMEKVEAVRFDNSRVKARIDDKNAGRIGREVLNINGLTKSFGERTLFANLEAI
ncbi:MAG: hypothetical protein RL169_590, partial [Armatimonadota bacterium]